MTPVLYSIDTCWHILDFVGNDFKFKNGGDFVLVQYTVYKFINNLLCETNKPLHMIDDLKGTVGGLNPREAGVTSKNLRKGKFLWWEALLWAVLRPTFM